MLIVIAIMAVGMLVGYLIRKRIMLVKINDKLIKYAIYLMLFIFGLSIGSNEVIIKNLSTLGLKAFVLAVAVVLGSIISGWFVYIRFFKSNQ